MSRDNNNSDRPKRPRVSTRKSSDDSRASRSGNSSGSKPFKKSFSKDGDKRGPEHKGSNSKFDKKPFNKNTESFEGSGAEGSSKSEKKPYITNKSESFERKSFGKSAPKRGSRSFDARDKYERGSLKYGRRPSSGDDRNEDKARSFVQKRRLNKIEKDVHKDSIRLNKYIANSGICSRREADELITQGLVEVNGKVVTEMGYQVEKTDRVVFDGQNITPEKPVYVLLNKPKGYISTTKDDKARKTVMDLVANASPYRVFPVGRLDRSTTGVILLTNDGHMTKKLTHPSFDAKKIYHVTLDKKLTGEDLRLIAEGIRLDEGIAVVDQISYIEGKPKNEIGIEIHIGWNRVIRRIFQRLGYEVEALDRVMFAGLTKKNIKRGHWRILTEQEVNNLKML
ncbi:MULTISPECIES: pseudouridine synthase [Chryseobacterium]|jgi:23S rRNA pseudouridine2605 synthase|uniref:Pseudouridine synthase n=1 Tax=Chryseobacterium rhizosphaerae TaxID=395937 RepID=A0AAE4C172_9FLAO|nr:MULTISPECIES: pseudouridine synthase [Chryseobacterium]MBL3547635.1 rRNA pseudouridine synthase [Chryseobacterium sp. KMC2]MDC8100337.1 rRNA pseudouridine synthase [Chryseobacterium rhizosphaerae]MDR6525213.1 23S rRNA pseudouridine2605 synthase [Chryseobacterium rhizosphaerae]MDR6545582.1 23S rRNA pseudouridine2605 synthase [Chryseobacterium rhizosphaerae]REC76278.1 rRNA pseudouridine synthase [Chryseobacterium rhizosphaerae]